MFDVHAFRATLVWFWERPENLTNAAFLLLVGLTMAFTLPRVLGSKHKTLGLGLTIAGVLFLAVALARPTGTPLPYITHGRYTVVQMKNTGGALFLTGNATRGDRKVKFWFLWQEPGRLGWNLPQGSFASDYVDGVYRGKTLCVGETPEYQAFIIDCTEER